MLRDRTSRICSRRKRNAGGCAPPAITFPPTHGLTPMYDRSNLRATLCWAESSADFRLHFQVIGPRGEPLAEIATFATDDPDLQNKLRIMAQAFRMGQKFQSDTKG